MSDGEKKGGRRRWREEIWREGADGKRSREERGKGNKEDGGEKKNKKIKRVNKEGRGRGKE